MVGGTQWRDPVNKSHSNPFVSLSNLFQLLVLINLLLTSEFITCVNVGISIGAQVLTKCSLFVL